MKVIVATRESQGARPSDFNDCVDGELVWMLDPCPESRRRPYGPCGCGRSFQGMNSHGSTTTGIVREFPGLTPEDYADALRASFDAQDWCECCRTQGVDTHVAQLAYIASRFAEGAVVERQLREVRVRR